MVGVPGTTMYPAHALDPIIVVEQGARVHVSRVRFFGRLSVHAGRLQLTACSIDEAPTTSTE
eukprot:1667774-Prymnesium_polylepis.1